MLFDYTVFGKAGSFFAIWFVFLLLLKITALCQLKNLSYPDFNHAIPDYALAVRYSTVKQNFVS